MGGADSMEDDDDEFGRHKGVCWEYEKKYQSMSRLYHNAVTHEVKINVAYEKLLHEVEKMGYKHSGNKEPKTSEEEEKTEEEKEADEEKQEEEAQEEEKKEIEEEQKAEEENGGGDDNKGDNEGDNKGDNGGDNEEEKAEEGEEGEEGEENEESGDTETKKQKESKTKWYILGAVCALVLCIACIVAVFFFKDNEEEDDIFIEERVDDSQNGANTQNQTAQSTEFPFEQTSEQPANINNMHSTNETTHDDIQRLTRDLKDYFGQKSSQKPSTSGTPMYIEHDTRTPNRRTPNLSDSQYVQERRSKRLSDISSAPFSK